MTFSPRFAGVLIAIALAASGLVLTAVMISSADDEPTNRNSNWTRIVNPEGACVSIEDESHRILENLDIGPCGGPGIWIDNASDITIRNVHVRGGVTNIHAHNSLAIVVEDVLSLDPRGPMPGGQHVLMDNVRDGVIRNVTTMFTGSGFQEDALNAYNSVDIVIEGNYISGGLSPSGCGIVIDFNSQHVTVRDNTIRNQANCGIGVASGWGHLVEGNSVFDYANLNVAPGAAGIYVWNQYPPACGEIVVRNNVVGPANPWWDGGNCGAVELEGNQFAGQ